MEICGRVWLLKLGREVSKGFISVFVYTGYYIFFNLLSLFINSITRYCVFFLFILIFVSDVLSSWYVRR